MFVTWIVTKTAALHPGFGLSWSEGVWTHVCIIFKTQTPPFCCPNVGLALSTVRIWLYAAAAEVHAVFVCRQQAIHKLSLFQCVQVAFGGGSVSSWRYGGVSIVGNLRDAVTGVVQDLLLSTHINIFLWTFKPFWLWCNFNIPTSVRAHGVDKCSDICPAAVSYLLCHLVRMVKRVFPFQEHPLLLRAS